MGRLRLGGRCAVTGYGCSGTPSSFSRTSPRIVPVSHVDGRPVAHEVPGPITKRLLAAHSEMVEFDIVEQALRFAKAEGWLFRRGW